MRVGVGEFQGIQVSGQGWLNNRLLVWAGALLITLLFFYGLDHFIMSVQGLPLHLDLTPAQ